MRLSRHPPLPQPQHVGAVQGLGWSRSEAAAAPGGTRHTHTRAHNRLRHCERWERRETGEPRSLLLAFAISKSARNDPASAGWSEPRCSMFPIYIEKPQLAPCTIVKVPRRLRGSGTGRQRPSLRGPPAECPPEPLATAPPRRETARTKHPPPVARTPSLAAQHVHVHAYNTIDLRLYEAIRYWLVVVSWVCLVLSSEALRLQVAPGQHWKADRVPHLVHSSWLLLLSLKPVSPQHLGMGGIKTSSCCFCCSLPPPHRTSWCCQKGEEKGRRRRRRWWW